MPYAVELYMSAHVESVVRDIWAAMAEAGICAELPSVHARPHVSLACYEQLEPDCIAPRLEQFAAGCARVPVNLPYVGAFPSGFLFLGATPTMELMRLHTAYHQEFEDCDRGEFRLYRRGLWVPHCTLATNLAPHQMIGAFEVARRFSLPLEGWLEQIALVKFKPTEELMAFALGNDSDQ